MTKLNLLLFMWDIFLQNVDHFNCQPTSELELLSILMCILIYSFSKPMNFLNARSEFLSFPIVRSIGVVFCAGCSGEIVIFDCSLLA